VPVPESFRRRFEAGGRERFQLVVGGLVDWHLAFGDERTTSRALAYLEPHYRKGVPAPESFGAHLASAWEKARRTIADVSSAGDPKRPEGARLRRMESVRRAWEAAAAYGRYVELAGLYMLSAEHYRSATLLDKAELYFLPAESDLPILFPGGMESAGIFAPPSNPSTISRPAEPPTRLRLNSRRESRR
jgi:hypothetical protein